jgi:hypothetical protein
LNDERNPKMKKVIALLMLVALLAMSTTAALANGSVTYSGQGFDEDGNLHTELCDELVDFGQDKDFDYDPAQGYLLWVLTANGASKASITGPFGEDGVEATLSMIQAGGGAFHKATPYYEVDELTEYPVSATWEGKTRGNVQLVVSHGCPPVVDMEFEGETAWAANGDVAGEFLYVEQGNWATYVEYAEKPTPLFAGQTINVGTVHFSAVQDGEVTITITLAAGWEFEDVPENLKVQDYEFAPSGNPAPGQFAHKKTCDAASNTCSIKVPENNFYGVHVNVGQWVPVQ